MDCRFPTESRGRSEEVSEPGTQIRESLDWYRAARDFRALIVEVAIAFTTSWCLGFSILDDSIRYLGAAEQVFERPGVQSGNLIDPERMPPAAAIDIGREICTAGQKFGYRGLVGLDMCIDRDARIFFFDLNFRRAGSTCFILLHDETDRSRQVGLQRSVNLRASLADALSKLSDLVRDRRYVPLQLFDGVADDFEVTPSRLTGFVRGASRREVEMLDDEIRSRLSKLCIR